MYSVSDNFKNLGFRFEGGNQGVTAKYVIDETKEANNGSTIRMRYMAFPNRDTGKFFRVSLNVFVDGGMVHYEDIDINSKALSGSACENEVIRFVKETMAAWNAKLGSNFSL